MVVRQSFVMSLLLASTLWAGGAFGVDKTPVATRLSAAQPAEWDSILDTATLAQVELALGFSGPAPPWAGRAGLRLVRGLAHVGQRGAALRWIDKIRPYAGPVTADLASLKERLTPQRRDDAVGVLGPLSGPYGVAGRTVVKAVKFALRGSGVTVHTHDTAGDESRAADGVRHLVEVKKVRVIIGPVGQKESLAAAVAAERHEVPIITLTRRAGITRTGTFVFRHRLTTDRAAEAVIEYAAAHLGVRELAILRPDSIYGSQVMTAVWSAARRNRLRVTGAQKYSPNARRFDDAIKGLIGRKVLDDRPPDPHWESLYRKSKDPALHVAPIVDFDALYIADSGKRLRLLLPFLSYWDIELRSLAEADVAELAHKYAGDPPRQVYVLGGPGFGASGFERLPVREAVNALFSDVYWSDTALGRKFDASWLAEFGRSPTSLAVHAYAAAQRAAVSIKSAKEGADVRAALLGRHESVFGSTEVDTGGEFLMPVRVLTISGEDGAIPADLPNAGADEDAPPSRSY